MGHYELIFLPAMAALVIGIAYFFNRYSWRKCLSLRLEGIRASRLAKQLLLDLQQHRGMVNAFLSGDISFKQKIAQKQIAIGQDIAALNASHGQKLMTAKRWEGIVGDWQALCANCLSLPAEASFRRHSELIRAVLYSISDIAERSQIVGLCTADFALVDALWNKIPTVAEGLGQARGLGASVAAKGCCSSVARIKLRFLEGHVREVMGLVSDDLARADLTQAASFMQKWTETHKDVQEFLVLLDEKLINSEHPTIDAEHYFNAGTKALDAVFQVFDQASSVLENCLTGISAGKRAV